MPPQSVLTIQIQIQLKKAELEQCEPGTVYMHLSVLNQ